MALLYGLRLNENVLVILRFVGQCKLDYVQYNPSNQGDDNI